MERLVRECFRRPGYVFASGAREIAREAGFDWIAELASNENPFAPSAAAITAAAGALAGANRYPDETMAVLRDAISAFHGDLSAVTGVGMDGVIETVVRMLVSKGDEVAISTPTFSFYGLAVAAQGGSVRTIPREEDFSVDAGRFIRGARDCPLSFLCTPNNPTGNATPPDVIEEILGGIEGLLFLDNAYVEFSGIDYRPLLHRHDNLIIGRTFSKAYALAGLRVGYGLVPKWLLPCYENAQTPFCLNAVSAAAARGALIDQGTVETYLRHVQHWRDRFTSEIEGAWPSDANFVMIDVSPLSAEETVEKLARQGVVVRSCTNFPGLGTSFIRVSIGEDWENQRFLDVMSAL
jgi:histidinol-phosphate aminotransferase